MGDSGALGGGGPRDGCHHPRVRLGLSWAPAPGSPATMVAFAYLYILIGLEEHHFSPFLVPGTILGTGGRGAKWGWGGGTSSPERVGAV